MLERELAAECWEVERQYGGQMMRPHCVVILRSKKESEKSIVTATSSDYESMTRYAEQLTEDLYALTKNEFVEKYRLANMT